MSVDITPNDFKNYINSNLINKINNQKLNIKPFLSNYKPLTDEKFLKFGYTRTLTEQPKNLKTNYFMGLQNFTDNYGIQDYLTIHIMETLAIDLNVKPLSSIESICAFIYLGTLITKAFVTLNKSILEDKYNNLSSPNINSAQTSKDFLYYYIDKVAPSFETHSLKTLSDACTTVIARNLNYYELDFLAAQNLRLLKAAFKYERYTLKKPDRLNYFVIHDMKLTTYIWKFRFSTEILQIDQ